MLWLRLVASTTTTGPITTANPSLRTTCQGTLSNPKWAYPCGPNTVCFDNANTANGVRCVCANGYIGNPYINCTKFNLPINQTRMVNSSLHLPMLWTSGLNDSTSTVYQTAVSQLAQLGLLENLMETMPGYVQSTVSIKQFRYCV